MSEQVQKVLIIDDDVRNIFALKAVLNARKYQCLTAADMQEALAILHREKDIGIILLDMMMPEMDGYEAIPVIRQIDWYAQVPVISVTAQAMLGDREKCLEAGANGYIAKPINVDELTLLLNTYLK